MKRRPSWNYCAGVEAGTVEAAAAEAAACASRRYSSAMNSRSEVFIVLCLHLLFSKVQFAYLRVERPEVIDQANAK